MNEDHPIRSVHWLRKRINSDLAIEIDRFATEVLTVPSENRTLPLLRETVALRRHRKCLCFSLLDVFSLNEMKNCKIRLSQLELWICYTLRLFLFLLCPYWFLIGSRRLVKNDKNNVSLNCCWGTSYPAHRVASVDVYNAPDLALRETQRSPAKIARKPRQIGALITSRQRLYRRETRPAPIIHHNCTFFFSCHFYFIVIASVVDHSISPTLYHSLSCTP